MDFNTEIRKTYDAALQHCRDTLGTMPSGDKGGPTNPMVIQPPHDYEQSKLKVMYVGQETNGWEGDFEPTLSIDRLLEVYDKFANGGGGFKYGGHFWNAIKHFQSCMAGIEQSTRFTSNNLVKIGKAWGKGRPPRQVLDWQESWFQIVKQEVQLLKPDVVIFFSGPDYD